MAERSGFPCWCEARVQMENTAFFACQKNVLPDQKIVHYGSVHTKSYGALLYLWSVQQKKKVFLWGTSVKHTREDQFQQPKVVWGDHFWLPKVVPRLIFGRTTFGTTHPSSVVWWRGAGQNQVRHTYT